MRRVLLSLVLLFCVSGCNEEIQKSSLPAYAKNQEQRAIWNEQALSSYQVNFNRSCFCTEQARAVFTLHVKNNAIEEAYIAADGTPVDAEENDLPTIADAFDKIDAFAEQGIDELSVEYHETLGYPTQIYANISFQMADEEIWWYFSDLE